MQELERYNPQEIEPKWQKRWNDRQLFKVTEDPSQPKFYYLDMFPYPSGELHMGHMRNYIIGDVISRFKRMQGFNVLHPMGYDAFGLPAENAAIQYGYHPAEWIDRCISRMRQQFDMLGISFDWSREIRTCDPEYYHWNQWLFLKLYERGLAYRRPAPVNWCPSCQTTLADEEAERGVCWRCGTPVTKKWLEQWFLRTTAYAEQLLQDLELLEHWPERVKVMQRNWIGKSTGVEFDFEVEGLGEKVRVFTTRIDTVYGVTFVVLAPEHPLVPKLIECSPRKTELEKAVAELLMESMEERTAETAEKRGVFLDAYAIHPLTGERVPIWTADYVLMEYGTGAIMAVPAHDQRDLEFARKYGLPVKVVIKPPDADLDEATMTQAYVEPGIMVNSGQFSGMWSEEAKEAIADYMEKHGIGKRSVQYRLRDWLISRQRYWGTPIPIVYCDDCGIVPVPEDQLPVLLPRDVKITGKGGSPLSQVPEFVNTTCPKCGGPAKRETDTMSTFVDSSWYFLRFCDPHNDQAIFDPEKVNYWMPVDQYVGGIEHAVGHLMYSRFITKVLYDLGLVNFREPFTRLFTQGMIYHEAYWCPKCQVYRRPKEVDRSETDGKVVAICKVCGSETVITKDKMSKSKLNVVTPEEICERYGADTGRLFILFLGPADQDAEWTPVGVEGCYRFLARLWRTVLSVVQRGLFIPDWRERLPQVKANLTDEERQLRRKVHQTVKAVTEDIEGFRFNTAVAAMMELLNELQPFVERMGRGTGDEGRETERIVVSEAIDLFLRILHPFAPHITDELWERLGNEGSLFTQSWAEVDEEALVQETITIVVQVNSRVRGRIVVPIDADEATIKELALQEPNVRAHLEGKEIKRIIIVPRKIVNIVV
jgi:leucyl-tRNA synthetase